MANGKKTTTQPKLVEVEAVETTPIAKPTGFSLERFKSKRADALANIGTELSGLKLCRISEAKDFVRLHPDEETTGRPSSASSTSRSRARRATHCT